MPSSASIPNEGASLHFMISALRAVVEMLLYCLVAQWLLGLLCGGQKTQNLIYQLFALVNRPWRKCLAMLLRRQENSLLVSIAGFVVLFTLWIGLAIFRNKL